MKRKEHGEILTTERRLGNARQSDGERGQVQIIQGFRGHAKHLVFIPKVLRTMKRFNQRCDMVRFVSK